MNSSVRRDYARILIVRLDRIGDVVLSTPAIHAVRAAYPKSHIAVMVRPYAQAVVEGNPYIDEVIVYDKTGRDAGLIGSLRFIAKLRAGRFDLAIALHPTARTHLILFAAGIPSRVGFDFKRGYLLTNKMRHTKHEGLMHEIDYTLGLLRSIGIDSQDRALYMPTTSGAERTVADLFTVHGITAGDLVVAVNPGASCPSKRWSAERFAGVASELSARYGAKIVIVAGQDDAGFGDTVAGLVSTGCLNLSGKTSVSELASVLKRAQLFISNDSGPVHIACALKTPVVAIFGRKDAGLSPRRWGPTGRDDIVIHKDIGCGICLAHECRKGFACLDAITVAEVVEAAGRLLAKRG